MAKILTDENFEKEINITGKLALVDFFATWCEPCSMLAPVLEKLEKEFSENIILLKANVDDVPLAAQKFKADRIPMVVLFKAGKPISAFTGFRPEEVIKEWLEKMIKENLSGETQPASAESFGVAKAEYIKESRDYAKKSGFHLNPDAKNVERIVNGLFANEQKHGKKYCPCRRLTGNAEEDAKKICPCFWHKDEIAKDNKCFCGLFVK